MKLVIIAFFNQKNLEGVVVLYLYHGKIHGRDHFLSVLEHFLKLDPENKVSAHLTCFVHKENAKHPENQALIKGH